MALKSHADPKCHAGGNAPHTLWDFFLAEWKRIRSRKPTPKQTGPTALTLAVKNNNTAIVEALVAAGARDIGEKLRGNSIELHAESSTDAATACTLLMYAASRKNPAIVRALVRSGSDVNAVDADKATALFYCKDEPTVDVLADCGTNLNAKDRDDWTALDNFVRGGSDSVCYALIVRRARDANAISLATVFGQTAKLKAMLAAGWDVDTKDEYGQSPLMNALYPGSQMQTGAALFLIQHGANVNFRDKEGNTPLLQAAGGGRYPDMDDQSPTVVKALLAKGAQVNAQNKSGTTPLMVAAFRLRPVLVRFLLQHAARGNLRTKDGDTALSRARKDNPYAETQPGCQSEVIRLLKAAGARE